MNQNRCSHPIADLEDTTAFLCSRRDRRVHYWLGQLRPLSARQSLTHFQCHQRVCFFQFAASLNNAIDLFRNGVSVYRRDIQKPRERRLLLLEQRGVCRKSLSVALVSALDLCLLIAG